MKQLFKIIELNQNFNNKTKNPVRFTMGIFCIFLILFSPYFLALNSMAPILT